MIRMWYITAKEARTRYLLDADAVAFAGDVTGTIPKDQFSNLPLSTGSENVDYLIKSLDDIGYKKARGSLVARAKALLLIARAWEEAKHPREPAGQTGGGRFTKGGTSGDGKSEMENFEKRQKHSKSLKKIANTFNASKGKLGEGRIVIASTVPLEIARTYAKAWNRLDKKHLKRLGTLNVMHDPESALTTGVWRGPNKERKKNEIEVTVGDADNVSGVVTLMHEAGHNVFAEHFENTSFSLKWARHIADREPVSPYAKSYLHQRENGYSGKEAMERIRQFYNLRESLRDRTKFDPESDIVVQAIQKDMDHISLALDTWKRRLTIPSKEIQEQLDEKKKEYKKHEARKRARIRKIKNMTEHEFLKTVQNQLNNYGDMDDVASHIYFNENFAEAFAYWQQSEAFEHSKKKGAWGFYDSIKESAKYAEELTGKSIRGEYD